MVTVFAAAAAALATWNVLLVFGTVAEWVVEQLRQP